MDPPKSLPDDAALREMIRNLERKARDFKAGRRPCKCPRGKDARGIDTGLWNGLRELEDRVRGMETNNRPCNCDDNDISLDEDQYPGLRALEDRIASLEASNKPCNCVQDQDASPGAGSKKGAKPGGSDQKEDDPAGSGQSPDTADKEGDSDEENETTGSGQSTDKDDTEGDSNKKKEPTTFLSLPLELRQEIYDWVWFSEPNTIIRAVEVGQDDALTRTTLKEKKGMAITYTGGGRNRKGKFPIRDFWFFIRVSKAARLDALRYYYNRMITFANGTDRGALSALGRDTPYGALMAAYTFLLDRERDQSLDLIRRLRIDLRTGTNKTGMELKWPVEEDDPGVLVPTVKPNNDKPPAIARRRRSLILEDITEGDSSRQGDGSRHMIPLVQLLARIPDLRHLDLAFEGRPVNIIPALDPVSRGLVQLPFYQSISIQCHLPATHPHSPCGSGCGRLEARCNILYPSRAATHLFHNCC